MSSATTRIESEIAWFRQNRRSLPAAGPLVVSAEVLTVQGRRVVPVLHLSNIRRYYGAIYRAIRAYRRKPEPSYVNLCRVVQPITNLRKWAEGGTP